MVSNMIYSHPDKFLVSVDCIVLGFHMMELKILTFKRSLPPFEGKQSLLGGFVNANESVDEAVQRVLHKLTGMESLYLEQVGTYGDIARDPGGRVISIAYYALINMEDYDTALLEKYDASWISLTESDKLIMDHKTMVDDAIAILRRKASAFAIGFNLLPDKFTLTQLQSLYEALYCEPLDKRNFRKKVLSLEILNRLEEKDKLHSRKGAYFYTLSPEYLEKLREESYATV
ncbi:MAG: DNA mismatch repair protein MutT [Bacteroidales bacterium]